MINVKRLFKCTIRFGSERRVIINACHLGKRELCKNAATATPRVASFHFPTLNRPIKEAAAILNFQSSSTPDTGLMKIFKRLLPLTALLVNGEFSAISSCRENGSQRNQSYGVTFKKVHFKSHRLRLIPFGPIFSSGGYYG